MPEILLAFEDIGLAVQLQESLEARSHSVRVDGDTRNGPTPKLTSNPDAVILFGDDEDGALVPAVQAWRARDPAPGIVVLGTTAAAQAAAARAHARFVPSAADIDILNGALTDAIRLRYAVGLTPTLASRALGVEPIASQEDAAVRTIALSRTADIDVVREALKWHAYNYVALDAAKLARLREHRALQIPEVEFARHIDGTKTIQTLVQAGPLDSFHAARFLWGLTSVGAATLAHEPPSIDNTAGRAVWAARYQLRARQQRLHRATCYDVLEVLPTAERPHLEQAVALLAHRYAPERLAKYDLGDLRPLARPVWEQVVKAHSTLADWGERRRYNEWLKQNRNALNTKWAVDNVDQQAANACFVRGQQALMSGEVHKAVSSIAGAARLHPDHPVYETYLAWARYRAQVSSGKDRAAVAKTERTTAEKQLAGCRPWPQALLALGLLCVADGDANSARWHLREALAVNPNLPAAQQILQRIGNR